MEPHQHLVLLLQLLVVVELQEVVLLLVQVVQAEEGYNLLMASQDLPSPISTGRRAGGPCPDGGCGLCRVEVVDGTGLSTQTERERDTIAAHVRGDPHEGRDREPGPPANELTRRRVGSCVCEGENP